jgi:hypothetical protein
MGIFVLVIFWVAVVFAFSVLNSKTALCFAGLWLLGFATVSIFHVAPYFFLAYEAVLAAILCIMLKHEWS